METESERRISEVAALDQPLRRQLYRLLRHSDHWISRDEAADALDVPRSVAAFHLDKLAEAGVAEVRFERTSGRTGPGAGRPAKLYRTRHTEVAASVPERHYDVAGSLMAAAIAESSRTGTPAAACLEVVAQDTGERIGREAGTTSVFAVLAANGYEPKRTRTDLVLANCPFHALAEEQRALVCHMNVSFVRGLLTGVGGDDSYTARLDPQPGYCCVRLTRR